MSDKNTSPLGWRRGLPSLVDESESNTRGKSLASTILGPDGNAARAAPAFDEAAAAHTSGTSDISEERVAQSIVGSGIVAVEGVGGSSPQANPGSDAGGSSDDGLDNTSRSVFFGVGMSGGKSGIAIKVAGGTLPSGRERERNALKQDTKERQADADLVREHSVDAPGVSPEGDGADRQSAAIREAIASDRGLLSTQRAPYDWVIIEYVYSQGKSRFAACELFTLMDETGPFQVLQVVCPRCLERTGSLVTSQVKIDSRNRPLHIDERKRNQVWVDPETGEAYRIAGTAEVPRGRCQEVNCGYEFRISSKNPDHPMCSIMKVGAT